MSRRLKSQYHTLTWNTHTILYIPPAAQKIEVVGISFHTDGTHDATFLPWIWDGANLCWRDNVSVTTGQGTVYTPYEGMVVVHGGFLAVFVGGPSSLTVDCTFDYVEVAPV